MQKNYELKYFLNARHFVIIDEIKSRVHPHNWLIELKIINSNEEILKFKLVDEVVENILSKYNDKLLNDILEFSNFNLTTEVIGEVLYNEISINLSKLNCKLCSLKISENAARTFVLNEIAYV